MPARDDAMAVDVSDPQGPDINHPVPEFVRPTPSNIAQVPGSSSAAVHPSPTACLSDAGVHSSAAGLCSPTAGECSSTTGSSLFAEGVPNAPGSHDDLDESEPSLDNLVEQAPAFCAQLVSMLNTLDSWSSLAEHYKASKKSKKD
jgi:hypothetical protein